MMTEFSLLYVLLLEYSEANSQFNIKTVCAADKVKDLKKQSTVDWVSN